MIFRLTLLFLLLTRLALLPLNLFLLFAGRNHDQPALEGEHNNQLWRVEGREEIWQVFLWLFPLFETKSNTMQLLSVPWRAAAGSRPSISSLDGSVAGRPRGVCSLPGLERGRRWTRDAFSTRENDEILF